MIQAEKIAAVMGMDNEIHSLFELEEAVSHGLPKKTLKTIIKSLALDANTAKQIEQRIIPIATYKRRKIDLMPNESERVERFARVYATALDVWGNAKDAKAFLFGSHRLLGNKRPIDLTLSELGARQVEQILTNIKYGLPV